MSSLINRNGWYFYQWYLHGRKKMRTTKTKDLTHAKRIQKLWDAKLEALQTGMAHSRISISRLIDFFIETKGVTIKESTLKRYKQQISALSKFFENINWVHQLNADLVNEFVADRKKQGKTPKAIFEEISILKSALKLAHANHLIDEIPIRSWPTIKKIPGRPERMGFYSKEEIAELKNYFREKEFERYFLFLIFTGCRYNEMLECKVRDVNIQEKIITIRSEKTESSSDNQFRYLAIHQELFPILKSAIENKKKDSLIFPEIRKHGYNWARRQLQLACKELGINYRRVHGLRHTFATYLLASGMDLRQAMAALGHERLETTQKYAHLAEKVANVNKLGY
ncbi:MAG: site-specific integrase [Candidatus Riflebacteria bacterium]|nr:site-specific integrase [Candidatus Riflebacteria bacterium]